tara:strand:+ start:1621 stop:1755 length:135 start_codon:yes stop_codon:yes gene_type:complete
MKFFALRSTRIKSFGWGEVLVPLPNRKINSNAALIKNKKRRKKK